MKTKTLAALAVFMVLGTGAASPMRGQQANAAALESQYVLAAALYEAAMQTDTLYQKARQALNEGQYRAAVEMFREFRQEEPESKYMADAMYYEAFALSRMRSTGYLRAIM